MTETFGVTEASWNRLLQALDEAPEVSRALLFGSRALGRARRGSDIDLAVEGEGVTSLVALDPGKPRPD